MEEDLGFPAKPIFNKRYVDSKYVCRIRSAKDELFETRMPLQAKHIINLSSVELQDTNYV